MQGRPERPGGKTPARLLERNAMEPSSSRRMPLLDEVRGILILLVCLYHLGYDLAAVFGLSMPWFFGSAVSLLRDGGAGLLMALSGVSCHLSRSNARRGAKTFALGMLLTAVTFAVMPSQRIVFGILHYFGLCMMLYAAGAKLLERVPPIVGAAVSAVLFAVTRPIGAGTLWLPAVGLVRLPAGLYQSRFLFWLGFPAAGFFSADYYPLIPWGFLFLFGVFLGAYWKQNGFPRCFYADRAPYLAWAGRHTLIIYLLHQPLLYGGLLLIFTLWPAVF